MRWAACRSGLLAAALGRPDDAAVHLDDAARRCDRLGALLLAARARAERARVLAARDHPAAEEGDRAGGNVFRRDGDVWTVAFNGRTVPLRDAKGLRDLAVLLVAPGREVAVTELVAGGHGGTATAIAALGADPPMADEFAVVGAAVFTTGPVALQLGRRPPRRWCPGRW